MCKLKNEITLVYKNWQTLIAKFLSLSTWSKLFPSSGLCGFSLHHAYILYVTSSQFLTLSYTAIYHQREPMSIYQMDVICCGHGSSDLFLNEYLCSNNCENE